MKAKSGCCTVCSNFVYSLASGGPREGGWGARGPGGPGLLFLNQTEAWRAENSLFFTPHPPPYPPPSLISLPLPYPVVLTFIPGCDFKSSLCVPPYQCWFNNFQILLKRNNYQKGEGENEHAFGLRKKNFTLYPALTLVVLHSKGLFRNIYGHISVVNRDLWQAVEILAINLRKGSSDLAFKLEALLVLKIFSEKISV